MVYACKPAKVSIYVNSGKKSIAQIKAETGCTALINGGLFRMSTGEPECHLKVDGNVLSVDKYKYWGFAWDSGGFPMLVSDYSDFDNYIACVCLVKDAKAEPLYYGSEVSGARPRTAIGTFADGRVWLFASADALTPEQLQKIALKSGVQHAIMLDSGGSTQCVFPTGSVDSSRIVHNFICVWEDPKGVNKVKDFKIALGAGHGLTTAGKRCDKTLDPNETSEWWLNDRVCDYIESYLKEYDGYSLLRLDDSDDGKDDIALATRVNKANTWGADIYISVHHNAGANRTSAGGACAFTHPKSSATSVLWRNDLYDALIKHTGLKGNRAQPKTTGDFYVLRESNMPAVLLELGFMDSTVDVPIILSNDFAKKSAKAIVEVIVKRGGLTKKAEVAPAPNALYKVQVGAFSVKENAEKLEKELEAKGYQAYIVKM